MKGATRIAIGVLLAGVCGGASLFAHHSFEGVFDGNRVWRIKGVITRFEAVNPHSIIFLDVMGENGTVERWALEGPAVNQLARRGIDKDKAFKVGETLAACGYGTKDGVNAFRSDAAHSVSGRFISAELLILPSGQQIVWSNYGQGKCFLNAQ